MKSLVKVVMRPKEYVTYVDRSEIENMSSEELKEYFWTMNNNISLAAEEMQFDQLQTEQKLSAMQKEMREWGVEVALPEEPSQEAPAKPWEEVSVSTYFLTNEESKRIHEDRESRSAWNYSDSKEVESRYQAFYQQYEELKAMNPQKEPDFF